MVKNQATQQREQRTLGYCWQWKANGKCSKGDDCSFRHGTKKRAKSTQQNPSPSSSTRQSVRNASRTTSLRGKSPSVRMSRLPCKDYLKGTCTTPFCEKWHPPECSFYKSENGCRFGENNIRDQNPSLGMICPGDPHQRNTNAQKFEDRSQEETERQERCARETAWKLAKSVLKLKEHERATFFSPSENRCLSASSLKPEEREFVVDSGASMHMISKKDLNSAELKTLTTSRSATTATTANGKVQTHAEATVYIRELDIFLTMEIFEDTPAVLTLRKLCDEHGYSYEWITGQKPHLIKNGIRIQCNTENFFLIVVLGLSTSSS